MFTITLAICHAVSKNPSFDPEALYIGTVILDVLALGVIEKIFS